MGGCNTRLIGNENQDKSDKTLELTHEYYWRLIVHILEGGTSPYYHNNLRLAEPMLKGNITTAVYKSGMDNEKRGIILYEKKDQLVAKNYIKYMCKLLRGGKDKYPEPARPLSLCILNKPDISDHSSNLIYKLSPDMRNLVNVNNPLDIIGRYTGLKIQAFSLGKSIQGGAFLRNSLTIDTVSSKISTENIIYDPWAFTKMYELHPMFTQFEKWYHRSLTTCEINEGGSEDDDS